MRKTFTCSNLFGPEEESYLDSLLSLAQAPKQGECIAGESPLPPQAKHRTQALFGSPVQNYTLLLNNFENYSHQQKNVVMKPLSYLKEAAVRAYRGTLLAGETPPRGNRTAPRETYTFGEALSRFAQTQTSSLRTLSSLLMLFFLSFGAIAQSQPDLKVKVKASNSLPQIGNTISYIVTVKNEGGATATGVKINSALPVPGVSYLNSVVQRGGGSYASASGDWSPGNIAAGDSAVLKIDATVEAQGVWFNVTEVTAMTGGTDPDSTPGNGILTEDDYDATCFSVPITWYKGYEFTVAVPYPGATQNIQWYKDGILITSQTAGATVNQDKSLTIKSPGRYGFQTTLANCPQNGCCDIIIEQGRYGKIGDYVWKDTNKNGIQDDGNTGVAGVKVELYQTNSAGVPTSATAIKTTTTDANGKYLFDSLLSDNYKVKFITSTFPADCSLTLADQGSDDTKDSDAGTDGFSPMVKIDVNKNGIDRENLTIDAGLVPEYGSIGDYVWKDVNGNGIQDSGEPGLKDVKVELYTVNASGVTSATPLKTTTTDASGMYKFTELASGDYKVKFVTATLPADCNKLTDPNKGTDPTKDSDAGTDGFSPKVTINAKGTGTAKDNMTIDAGILPYGSIGDYVWKDLNGNGIQDGSEPGIKNVTVELWTANADGTPNVKIRTTTTDTNGKYLFTELLKGDYVVRFVTSDLPADCNKITNPGQGTDPGKDSNPNPTTGITPKISLDPLDPAKKDILTIDAGIVPDYGSIGDFVWKDVNGNGIQDSGEKGVKDVIVELYAANAAGNPTGAPLKTTTTDADGYYIFTELSKGDYVVKFVTTNVPADCRTFTTPNQGTDPTKDSKANPSGVTPKISIDPAVPSKKNITNVDAGLVPTLGSIGDFVWKDVNGNGIQDAGEKGVKDVIVELYAANAAGNPTGAPLKTTTTDANGYYLFSDLSKGDYVVKFVTTNIPADCRTFTTPGQGTDPNKDSKANSGGVTPKISLDPGDPAKKNITNIDAGLVPQYGSIGDYVWKDENKNGIQDAGEKGVKGAKVELYTVSSTGALTFAQSTTTDANGMYKFTGLASGDYKVKFLTDGLPADCNQLTKANQGTDTTKDSDAGTDGFTATININAGFPAGDPRRDNMSVDAGLLPGCTPPTVAAGPDKTICSGETASIKATANPAATSVIKWYYSPTGGTAFGSSNSGEDFIVSPSTTTTYYAEAVVKGTETCVSTRVPVVVVVNARPSNPTCVGNVSNECPATTVNLNKHIINGLTSVGGKFEWHVGPSPTSALVPDATMVGAGTYYLFEVSGAGCYSNPTLLTVNIVPCGCKNPALADAGADQTVCEGSPVSISGKVSGSATTGSWTTSGTGTFANANNLVTTYTPSAADVAAGSVTIKLTTNKPTDPNCTAVTDALILTINPTPAAPYGLSCADSVLCLGEKVKLFGIAPGFTIKWYTTATGGTAIGTSMSGGSITVAPTTTTMYYAEAVSPAGCISKTRTPIEVKVKVCVKEADLSLTKTVSNTTPKIGDQVTYTITVKNSGPENATNVSVKDVLPSGITFVSSSNMTFSGGVLTGSISQIAVGASATFSYVVTVTGSGSITNRAEVATSDQKDPDSTPGNGFGKGEDDEGSVTITPQCDVKPVVLVCAKTTICLGESTKLDAVGCEGGTITWSNGATGSSITVSPTADTDYTAICTIGNCKSGISNTMPVKVIKVSAPVIACKRDKLCLGDSETINSAGCDGTVVWSNGMTGQSITITPTETMTYTAVCKKGDCVSAASNPLTISIIKVSPPSISADKSEVCAGGIAKLTATGCAGTVTWSNGMAGSSINVTPSVATTYTATCTVDGCMSKASDGITIKVANPAVPIITCAATNICPGGSVALSAAGCTGTVMWSNGASGNTITVSPSTSTNYTAYCQIGDCKSQNSNTISVTVGAITAPVVTASATSICGSGVVTLTAAGCAGNVEWNTGQKGASINVNVTTTTVFSAICKDVNCTSDKSKDVTVTVSPVPAAPVVTCGRMEICLGESETLTAHNCSGTVVWSTGATGTTLTVTPTTTTTYTASCKVNGCMSVPSNDEVITVISVSAPTLSCTAENICAGGTTTITATGCAGTVTWSTGATGNSITVSPMASTQYTATCKVGNCVSPVATKTINVSSVAAPLLACSNENICAGGNSTLTAVGCPDGTITWNTGATGTTLTVSPATTTTYSATCTMNGCTSPKSAPKTVNVTVVTPPTVTASTATVCAGSSVTLNASGCAGTVTWSTGQTGASITATPGSTTVFTATCSNGKCTSAASAGVTVTVANPSAPTISCNTESICPGGTVTLNASGCAGTVMWSNGQTGASINVVINTTTTFTAVCKTGDCTSGVSNTKTVTVKDVEAPIITASTDATCPGGTATLTASGCAGGTITWSNGQTGASITVTPSATATYTAICKIGDCVSQPSAGKTITVGTPSAPVISASASAVCSGSNVTLTATGCAGAVVWSNGQTGASITVPVSATTTFSAVCTQGTCNGPVSNKVTVTISSPTVPTITCTASQICAGENLTLNALGCEGTVEWSNGQTGNSITISPATTTTYSAVCKVGDCKSASSSVATITVGPPNPPVLTCPLTTICYGAKTDLTAAGCVGTVIWSNGMEGNVITVSPTATTSYTAICKGKGGCQSGLSGTITITVGSQVKKPVAKDLTNTCPFVTVNLNSGVTTTPSTTGGVFEFRTGNTPTSPLVTNVNAASEGVYYVFEKSGNGCYSEGAMISVDTIRCGGTNPDCATNPAIANAGDDQTVCSEKVVSVTGRIAGAAKSGKWSTSGTGTFANPSALTTTYRSSLEDVIAGKVKLVLTTDDPDGTGPCKAASDTMVLTMTGPKFRPTITNAGSLTRCAGDSVTLTAQDGYAYKWSNGATTRSITVKASGSYTVKLIDANKCCSIESDPVEVVISPAVAAPVAAAEKCSATTVDLSSMLTKAPATGNVYEYHIGNTPSSAVIVDPKAVSAGNYYVFEKTPAGCYSEPTKLKVTISSTCSETGKKSDLSIVKKASAAKVKVGSNVVYTLEVKNAGPDAATNVEVTDVLPVGLEGVAISSTASNITLANNTFTGKIAKIEVGQTVSLTVAAKVTSIGGINNIASISKADQEDNQPNDNKGSVSINDTTSTDGTPIYAGPGRLGIAKSVAVTPVSGKTNQYDVTYTLTVSNMGGAELKGVQVNDTLSKVFTNGATFTKPVLTADAGFVIDEAYTGKDDKVGLLVESSSNLPAGTSRKITLKTTIDVSNATGAGLYNNIALAKATIPSSTGGAGTPTSDISTPGTNPDPDKDGNPGNNTGSTGTTLEKQGGPISSLGIAYSVRDTVKQANGSYNVTYWVIVKNTGTTPLTKIQALDTLSNGFKAPVSFTIVNKPSVETGATLVPNANFNGTAANANLLTDASQLAVGATDTIRFTINVVPGTAKGPFTTQVSGAGTTPTNTVVTAKSSNGTNPSSTTTGATPLSFGVPAGKIGLAKSVTATKVGVSGNTYELTYLIKVCNLGTADLTKVSVKDDLKQVFTDKGAVISTDKIIVNAESGLVINPNYTGVGLNTDLLVENESSLKKGENKTVTFKVKVDVSSARDSVFSNIALGKGTLADGTIVEAASQNGTECDPTKGSSVTPYTINSTRDTRIGLAMVGDTIRQANGSYNVAFRIVVKNLGGDQLNSVQVLDSLSKAFPAPAKFTMVTGPTVNVSSKLKPNTAFNGVADAKLLIPDQSTLGVGVTDTIKFVINVIVDKTTTFENSALGTGVGLATKVTVSDKSTAGLLPDKDGDGKADGLAESETTKVTVKVPTQNLSFAVPEGFSPNGDGINDKFVITGLKATEKCELTIFNRWGHCVYLVDDYKNEWGGEINQGVKFGTGALPDGTYFYKVRITDAQGAVVQKDGKDELVRYFTIAR